VILEKMLFIILHFPRVNVGMFNLYSMTGVNLRFVFFVWIGFLHFFTPSIYAQWPQGKYWVPSPFEWSNSDTQTFGKGISWWSLDPVTHQLQGFFDLSSTASPHFSGQQDLRPLEVPFFNPSCHWQGFSMTAPGTFQPEQHPMINVPFSLPFLIQSNQGDVSVLLEARYQNSTRFSDPSPFLLRFSFEWEVMAPGFPGCLPMTFSSGRMEVQVPMVVLNTP
jgi:hypothetical protein